MMERERERERNNVKKLDKEVLENLLILIKGSSLLFNSACGQISFFM